MSVTNNLNGASDLHIHIILVSWFENSAHNVSITLAVINKPGRGRSIGNSK